MSLTGLRDIDRMILDFIPDEELLEICRIDRRTCFHVCDDQYLRRRLTTRYLDVEKEKCETKTCTETWKQFFARVLYYKKKMWKNFGYQYRGGDFVKQYRILYKYKDENLLNNAAAKGELDLVKYAWDKTEGRYKNALIWPAFNNHLNILKYLVEQGCDVHAENETSLRYACYKGYLEIVKYLVENGADIRASNNEALKLAVERGQHHIIKYLTSR